jgi:D-alanyl-D-alanine carboxypeptidase/D-alanyl-D-alanine-endopeptidase (penicillin-binding protein 4)
MRARLLALLGVVGAVLLAPGTAVAQTTPVRTLARALHAGQHKLGRFSGAYVVDLTTGLPLFAIRPDSPRVPASVEKLYTTSTALLEFGPTATLSTELLGRGTESPTGVWSGTLYLRGGGDPTFGTLPFDRAWYGGGATIGALVSALQRIAHLTALQGRIVGDASYFDALPSTIESGFTFDPYMEGSLSALAFNRGLLDGGNAGVANPPVFAAAQLAAALRRAHVKVGKHPRLGAGVTPASAQLLATVQSPPMAQLIALTNTPSDNFFAETLTKDLGARFGGAGTTAAGVAVIKAELSSHFGLAPRFDDGSGLSRDDATTPRQVVSLLAQMADNPDFVNSLAVGGETGTLQHEMVGTPAQGACRGKTGTLIDVASLAGYCQAADGHTLAFAFLANRLGDPELGHQIEASMAVALARYNG